MTLPGPRFAAMEFKRIPKVGTSGLEVNSFLLILMRITDLFLPLKILRNPCLLCHTVEYSSLSQQVKGRVKLDQKSFV